MKDLINGIENVTTNKKEKVNKESKFYKIMHKVAFVIVLFTCFLAIIYRLSGIRLFTIVSESMEPTIMIGDASIASTKTKFENIAIGDIIIYKDNIM